MFPGSGPRCLAGLLFLAGVLSAGDLYLTDFESFEVGPDQWAGADGWLGTSPGTASHGVSLDLVPGLGKTAYLGLNQPASTFVRVFRPVDHDPFAEGTAEFEFETLIGLQDSTNGRFDDFYFSFYNIAGEFLGGILLSNSPLSFGIWRLDGSGAHDTGIDFTHGELHLLRARIDPHANTWSADFDALPLFADASFNATGKPLTLGAVAAEWQLNAGLPSGHGDNWLLVADWRITAVPVGEEPFVIDSVSLDPSGQPVLSWTGEPGWDYRVQHSADAVSWHGDLPGSFFTGLGAPVELQFTDPTPRGPTTLSRFYRVLRTVTP